MGTYRAPGQIIDKSYQVANQQLAAGINKYDKLFAIKSDNMSGLLKELKKNDKIKSAFSFGEYHHISFNEEYKADHLDSGFLNSDDFKKIEIKSIMPTVEDCFIHLMSIEENYEN